MKLLGVCLLVYYLVCLSLIAQAQENNAKVDQEIEQNGNSTLSDQSQGQNATNSQNGIWKRGRATFFGGPNDAQSDATLEENVPVCVNTNRISREQFSREKPAGFYAALSDSTPEFDGPLCIKKDPNNEDEVPECPNQGSCGKCFEVRCVAKLDRQQNDAETEASKTCTKGASVIVRVIDACPHNHPINIKKKDLNPCKLGAPPHFDLGHKAFEILAPAQVGIIHMEYRRVDCNQGLGRKNNGLTTFIN